MVFLSSYLLKIILKEISVKLSKKADYSFECEILEKNSRIKYDMIENSENYELLERIYDGADRKITSGLFSIASFLGIIVNLFSVFVIIMTESFYISFVVLIQFIVMIVAAYNSGEKEYESYKTSSEYFRRAKVYSAMQNSAEYSDERYLFDYKNNISAEWEKYYEYASKRELKTIGKNFFRIKSLSILMSLTAFSVSAVMLFPLIKGEISAGLYISITGAVFSLVHPMSWTFSDNVKKLVRDMNYMNDYNKFISLPETELKNSNENLYEKPETISFRNVSFKYPGNVNYVLKNFSLELKKNKSYAFVGANGAGKSTVIKLLLGIYEDYTGDILINGKNQKNILREQWYRYFSVVFQDFSKYQISVKNNITMGKSAENKIQKIAEISGVSEILETLPEKENTVLGYTKNGHDLSGGQWQKIALSRALFRDSEIQILDEPTASLDPVTEKKLYEDFSEIPYKSMKILITHRLGGVKSADEILVLDSGKITENGNHEELMKKRGLYYEMYESQRKWYSE